ncbi:hypothetical protein ARMA_2320 [Ardenticatena maritima]|uniref:Uncharacterized protein n=1 Tax=Ardenticatena maritima TaxID=872965 RepID=A0A0M9UDE7_9CHLR|nr:hypothetical protein ARMA_2320 [Ardenticatena maritima]
MLWASPACPLHLWHSIQENGAFVNPQNHAKCRLFFQEVERFQTPSKSPPKSPRFRGV